MAELSVEWQRTVERHWREVDQALTAQDAAIAEQGFGLSSRPDTTSTVIEQMRQTHERSASVLNDDEFKQAHGCAKKEFFEAIVKEARKIELMEKAERGARRSDVTASPWLR